jgi:hypothetical protein
MRTDLFRYVTLSPQENQLRFTNDPGPRTIRLRGLEGIDFQELPRPMTKQNAALWLRGERKCAALGWQQAIARRLKMQERALNVPASDDGPPLPEEVDTPPESLPEGAVRRIVVNAYERNPQARALCLDHYGTACTICGFDFGVVYGDEADDTSTCIT